MPSFLSIDWSRLGGAPPPARGPTIFTQSQEFDVMVANEKIVFTGQNLLGFPDQVDLFPDEIPVIDDLSAMSANQVVVMALPFPGFQLVAALSVRHIQLVDQPGAV